MTDPKPVHANFKYIYERHHINYHVVMKMVDEGKVRSFKTGPSKTAQRLFRVADLEKAIDQLESEELSE